ncbi:hypothetical protein MSSIH_2693 [Methanosarcina siciliae HI350]|uniref:Endonuclease GajA/Old nuclease/RecF-like AAA domain-containing protein n=1 Tax=Methanosarcina siciliae HI350 TaxID=1434119 RepID=A0A0E3PFI9_9EURY|nr:ATP-binding protein [Methanosarcina siciliae]AKB33383.1 hypothetical protein MSSIH_2693 [Methanosarcina siciliae HI350]
MKIDIKNMGAVKEGQVEIKPLTVFIGPNNSGKTWAAYAISSIFSPFSWKNYTKDFSDGFLEEKYPEIDNLIDIFFNRGNANLNIVQFFKDNSIFYINNLAKLSPSWMNYFLGTDNVSFENLSLSCIEFDTEHSIERLLELSLNSKLSPDEEGEPIVRANKNKQDPFIYFYLSEKRKSELPRRILINSIYEILFHYIHRGLYFNVRYLPAERTGFVSLLASEVIKNSPKKDSILDDNTSDEDIDFLMPIPIIDMIRCLGIIKTPAKYNSTIKKRMNDKKKQTFFELAEFFENTLLGGVLEYEEDHVNKGVSNLCYRYDKNKDVPLELQVVSSTVKDLAPLSIYLKCLLNENELLVIDEPEMNLHPINQAKFIEFLAMLVNAGVNVLLTTHSPYITNHLENLIKAYDSEQTNIETSFYLKRRESLISKESVSVYNFGNGCIESILGENGDIDLESFSKVGEEISEIYYEIE